VLLTLRRRETFKTMHKMVSVVSY